LHGGRPHSQLTTPSHVHAPEEICELTRKLSSVSSGVNEIEMFQISWQIVIDE